jgi:hypothetical protein
LLKACVAGLEELAQRSELADDRLARATLPVAREALEQACQHLGPDDGRSVRSAAQRAADQ